MDILYYIVYILRERERLILQRKQTKVSLGTCLDCNSCKPPQMLHSQHSSLTTIETKKCLAKTHPKKQKHRWKTNISVVAVVLVFKHRFGGVLAWSRSGLLCTGAVFDLSAGEMLCSWPNLPTHSRSNHPASGTFWHKLAQTKAPCEEQCVHFAMESCGRIGCCTLINTFIQIPVKTST